MNDADSGDGISFAQVQVMGPSGVMGQGYTDESGFYSIRIHKDSITQVHSIMAASFLTSRGGICPILTEGTSSTGNNIRLTSEQYFVTMGMIVYTPPLHVRLWNQVKYFFLRPFRSSSNH